jgi:hypothetical protein
MRLIVGCTLQQPEQDAIGEGYDWRARLETHLLAVDLTPPDGINITVTAASEPGDLRLYPGATVAPLASAINYASGQTRASNAVVALGVGGTLTIQCDQPSGSVHAIVDTNGYFR